ncbi:MAG TPA: toll/interleukin-1 receptor domain-containing protein [Chloroflexia bacterium]|nr:toll/interleukin-1 receptor domain-containing protein [Chloroflexia bacterium]
MANPEHVELIKQGVEVWNKWREEHQDAPPILAGADLAGVGLTGANLNRAYLVRANLNGAILNKADLTWANLTLADLNGAVLNKADLSHAILGHTKFLAVDLRSVIGLELTTHDGPSYIDTQTLQHFQGKVPEIFLRGAGLSDEMISLLRNLHGKSTEFYSCFVTYSPEDKVFAQHVYDTLQRRGIRCWLDELRLLQWQIGVFQLDPGIRISDKILLCCSEHLLTDIGVKNGIELAVSIEERLAWKRGEKALLLIPLNLDGYLFKPEWQKSWKGRITERLVANFTGWEHDNSIFETQIEQVVKALMVDDAGREALPTPRL